MSENKRDCEHGQLARSCTECLLIKEVKEVKELESQLTEKEALLKQVMEAARLGLSFAPRGEVPQGLCPTFYHTLSYESECELQGKIDSAREFLAKLKAKGNKDIRKD